MKRPRLFWLVFPSYVAITCGVLVVLLLDGGARLREFYRESVAVSLETDARMFAETAGDLLSKEKLQPEKSPELNALAKRLGEAGGIRITVVLPSG